MFSRNHRATSALAFALLTVAGTATVLAGPLDPPAGPITSSYKTLTEVEPRVAINVANTPGDGNSVFKITQPGSYYLTGNITGVSGKRGIEIAASNVTIDLMGFTLQGVAGSLDGIATDTTCNALTVRNGTVSGWEQTGIDLTDGGTGLGSLVEGVTVAENSVSGMRVNDNAVVRGCVAANNGQDGIAAPSNAAIEACSARQNGSVGFSVGGGSTVTNCSARRNIIGIAAFESSTITGCAAFGSTFHGIYVDTGSTVQNCTSHSNGEHGIVAVSLCTVRDNTCHSNGVDASSGAGISIGGFNNRVEGNNCAGNDWGILCSASANFITRNTCAGNTTANWDVSSGNKCLVESGVSGGAILGNSGGVSPGSTDPNANYSY